MSTATKKNKQKADNFVSIIEMFGEAKGTLPSPRIKFSFDDCVIWLSFAAPDSVEPGSVVILGGDPASSGTWHGRILTSGMFRQGYFCNDATMQFLNRFAENPANIAARYGKGQCRCCFCDSELVDEWSTVVGYHPSCASHYGLPRKVK